MDVGIHGRRAALRSQAWYRSGNRSRASGDRSTDAHQRNNRVQYRCSFCGKTQEQVRRLIAGPGGVYICDECVELCREIIEEEASQPPQKAKFPDQPRPHPKRIYEQLNQYVIGQDRAKKVLSVAVYNHYKRISAGMQIDEVELQKSNILLVGPTGCGKTLLARRWPRSSTCRSPSPTPPR